MLLNSKLDNTTKLNDLSTNGNIDVNYNQIKNIAEPTDLGDCVNLLYFNTH